MRSTGPPDGDQSTPARIRQTAAQCFAQDGFSVSLRTIAEAAGVSPGLIIHHFGSKDGLRQAVDDAMRQRIVAYKSRTLLGTERRGEILAILGELDDMGDMMGYLLQSLRAGGDLARDLLDSYIDLTEELIANGVGQGTMRPSLDPRGQAEYLVLISFGMFLTYTILHPDRATGPDLLHGYAKDLALPALELLTNGLLADSTALDTYLEASNQPTHPNNREEP